MIFSDNEQGFLNSVRKAPYIAIDAADHSPTKSNNPSEAEAKRLHTKELAYFNGKKIKGIQMAPNRPQLFLEAFNEKIYARTFYEEHDVDFPFLFQNYQEDIATLVYIDRSATFFQEIYKGTLQDSQGRKKYFNELTLGNQYLFGVSINKNLQEAIMHYGQALLFLPNSLQASNNLACAYIQSQQYNKAEKVLLSSIKTNRYSYQLYHNLAYAKLMIGKLKGDLRFPFIIEVKEAEDYLNKALLANPNSFQTIHNLANISVYRKQYKEAIEQYKKGLKINEKYSSSLYSLAITYKLAGEYALSLETYLLCLKYHKNHAFSLHGLANLLVDLIYLQIGTISCKHMDIFSLLVKCQNYFELSQSEKMKCIEQIYKLALQSIVNSSLILSGLGNLYIMMRRYDFALKTFQRAIYFNKRCYPAYIGSGLALYYLKRYVEAVVWFEQCFKINRRSQKALLGKFHSLIKLGKVQEAKSILNMMKALFNEPNINYYYSCLTISEKEAMVQLQRQFHKSSYNSKSKKIAADIMLEFNRFETALMIYSILAEQQGFMNLDCLIGICHYGLGHYMQSMQNYIQALNKNSQDSKSLLRIAQFFFEKGQLRDSWIIVNKLLQINGNSIKVLTLYAKILEQTNKMEQLISVLTLILKLSCYSSQSYNNLAFANIKKGDIYESNRNLQLALNKDESNYILLNNLGNIYHQKSNYLANDYYLKAIVQDQSIFVPYINMAATQQFEKTLKQTPIRQVSTIKRFNVSLYFLFKQEFDISFQYFTYFLQDFNKQSTNPTKESLNLHFLGQNFPKDNKLRKALELYLYLLNNKSESYLKHLLKSYNLTYGYRNAVLRLKTELLKPIYKNQQNCSSILLQILAAIFKISHYEGVMVNGVLCWNDYSFQDNTLRIQMYKQYQLQDLQMVKSCKEFIVYTINNKPVSQIGQNQILLNLYSNLQKVNKIRQIITSNQQPQKLYQQLLQEFAIEQRKFVQHLCQTLKAPINHYQEFRAAYIEVLELIQTEEQILETSLQHIEFMPNKACQQSGEMITEIFLRYYQNSYFVNTFIAFTYNTFIFYIQDEDLETALKGSFIRMKNPQNKMTFSELQGNMKKTISLMDKQSKLTSRSNRSKFNPSISTKSQQNMSSQDFQSQEQAIPQKKAIIEDEISQQSSLIFERISQYSHASFLSQETIFTTANNNTPQYNALRKLVQSSKQYQGFNILLNKNRKDSYEYITKKSKLLKHMNPNLKYNAIMEQGQLVTIDNILNSCQKEVIDFLLCLTKGIIEIEELCIFHQDIQFRNIIKSSNHFKIIDFDYVFFTMPCQDGQGMLQNTQKILQMVLQSPPQIQQNMLKFIFKYNNHLQDLMKISEQYGSDDLKIGNGVKILMEKLNEHSMESHFRQFSKILQEILDHHNFNHIFGKASHEQITIRQFLTSTTYNYLIYKAFFDKFQKFHASIAQGTSCFQKSR